MNKVESLIVELENLIEQATKERSHYYVASCARKAVSVIKTLYEENRNIRKMLLEEYGPHDDFGFRD